MHTNTTGGEHDRPLHTKKDGLTLDEMTARRPVNEERVAEQMELMQHQQHEQPFWRVLSARYCWVGFPRATRKMTVRSEDFATEADALEVRDYYRREFGPGEWAQAYKMMYLEPLV